jgi:hypothetical protein
MFLPIGTCEKLGPKQIGLAMGISRKRPTDMHVIPKANKKHPVAPLGNPEVSGIREVDCNVINRFGGTISGCMMTPEPV